MKVQQEFNTVITKMFAYENMKTRKQLEIVLDEHIEKVREILNKKIPDIVYNLTKQSVRIYDHHVNTDGELMMLQHSKTPLYIPGLELQTKKYNQYRKELKITIFFEILKDLNLIKLKDYKSYTQLFDQYNIGHLGTNVLFTIRHSILHLQYEIND